MKSPFKGKVTVVVILLIIFIFLVLTWLVTIMILNTPSQTNH